MTPLYTEEDEKELEESQDRKQKVIGNVVKLNGKGNNNPETIELKETNDGVNKRDVEIKAEGIGMVNTASSKADHVIDKLENSETIIVEPDNTVSDVTDELTNGQT